METFVFFRLRKSIAACGCGGSTYLLGMAVPYSPRGEPCLRKSVRKPLQITLAVNRAHHFIRILVRVRRSQSVSVCLDVFIYRLLSFLRHQIGELAHEPPVFDSPLVHPGSKQGCEPSYANPYGVKVFSKCYWPATFKKNGFRWWTVFVEKYSGAFLYGKYPANAGGKFKQELLDALGAAAADAVGISRKARILR